MFSNEPYARNNFPIPIQMESDTKGTIYSDGYTDNPSIPKSFDSKSRNKIHGHIIMKLSQYEITHEEI